MSLASKLYRVLTYLKELLVVKSHKTLVRGLGRSCSYYIYTTTVPMATEIGRMVTYLKWLSPIKLPEPLFIEPLVKWSC